MPIIGVPAPHTSSGPTRAYIKEIARHFLDELIPGRLQDTTASQFGLDAAVDEAYIQYSKETQCFRGDFSAAAIAAQAVYDYSTFDTGTPVRLFEIYAAKYNGSSIRVLTLEELESMRATWRDDSAGSPSCLVPWDEKRFKVFPTPSGTDTIYVEGWLIADLSTFTEDNDEADVHQSRAMVLGAGTAVIAAIRFADVPSQQVQKADCYGIWTEGTKNARREVHGVSVPVVGGSRQSVGGFGTNAPLLSIHGDLII